jgi:hypothetical protein
MRIATLVRINARIASSIFQRKMIRVRVKIGDDGQIQDTSEFGFIYIDSDKRVGPDLREFEVTTYPEQDGENILPKTSRAPFDYTVKFFIQASSIASANDIIDTFNRRLYTVGADGLRTYKQVTFFNDYKRHKIVGVPYEISEAQDFWRDRKNQEFDVVLVEWKIRVTTPQLCEFKTPFTDDSGD